MCIYALPYHLISIPYVNIVVTSCPTEVCMHVHMSCMYTSLMFFCCVCVCVVYVCILHTYMNKALLCHRIIMHVFMYVRMCTSFLHLSHTGVYARTRTFIPLMLVSYIYIYIYIYTHTYIHTYIYVYSCAIPSHHHLTHYSQTHTHTYIHNHFTARPRGAYGVLYTRKSHTHMYTYIHNQLYCSPTWSLWGSYILANHTYTHTHMYTYIHTYTISFTAHPRGAYGGLIHSQLWRSQFSPSFGVPFFSENPY
jgi:hypothetical protein